MIHQDAAFSGFSVNDLAAAKRFYAEILEVEVEEIPQGLRLKGIKFEQYPGVTDHLGIARGITSGTGPDIAWFKDPAGNTLSVLQQA